jgi:hypothetical protein
MDKQLIPLSEFIAARSERNKRAGLGLVIALFLMGIYCAILINNLEAVTVFVVHHFAPPVAGIIQGFLLFPMVFILMFIVWLYDRKSSRDQRLRCPHCGKRLDNASGLVVATKNCPDCGQTALSEAN